MKLESKMNGHHLVVKIREERMSADRALSFKQSMAKFIQQGQQAFVIDFSEVTFIDSSGLGALLSSLKRVATNGEILVVGTSETVGNMFRLTRMHSHFPDVCHRR